MTYNPQAIAEYTQRAIDELNRTAPPTNGEWVAPLVAQIRNNGTVAAVSNYYCGFCRDGDCEHVRRVQREWDFAVMMYQDDQAAADYADESRERYAVMAGVA